MIFNIFAILSLICLIFLNFISLPIYLILPLAVGFGVMLMIALNITHPPAGGNPIIIIMGSVSFDYLLMPVVVGSIIGFLLDGWFDTKPLLTICFFIIGVAAGMLNVFRSAKKMHNRKYKN